MIWTKQQARRYWINYQMIHRQASSMEEVFSRLKTIQYDPLNVVGTNPELVLQSRIKGFVPNDLYHALYQTRYLVDGWDKQMSIFRSEEFPFFQPIRESQAKNVQHSLIKYLDMDIAPFLNETYNILQERGPLFSRDISLGTTKGHKWGRTKPSSAALDYLFQSGRIGVHSRQGSHKQYDLMERLLPNVGVIDQISEEDYIAQYLLRRIQCVGLCWNRPSTLFLDALLKRKSVRQKHLKILVEQGLILPITIEGINDTCYIPKEGLNISQEVVDEMSILAPLDNMMWDRDFIETLFDFYYRWEVYTPLAKRQYGYYVLPILYRDELVGRIEFENFKQEMLVVKQIWWEDGTPNPNRYQVLRTCLETFAQYLSAKGIQLPK